MIEQEMASIIKFVLDRAGGPAPYYWNVPQHFTVPAAYFPPPEIETGGETFLTYNVDYAWYIKIFHKTAQGAYALGNAVTQAIRAAVYSAGQSTAAATGTTSPTPFPKTLSAASTWTSTCPAIRSLPTRG